MFALKVSINEEKPIIAGAEDLGVLTAMVNCGGVLGSATHPYRSNDSEDFRCTVGGLTRRAPGFQNEHVRWLEQRKLKVGDRMTIEIVQTDEADPVVSGTPSARGPSRQSESTDGGESE